MSGSFQMSFTSPPDPTRVWDMLREMGGEDGAGLEGLLPRVKEMMGKLEENMEWAASRPSREDTLRRFRKAREGQLRMHRECGHFLATTQAWNVKPSEGPAPAAADLVPIAVKELQVGTTHRGRVLQGTIIEKPIFTGSSATFLLEDAEGELVEVAVYNVPGMNWAMADVHFPKGRMLAIAEPFYKVRGDLTPGVRVDVPAEISEWVPSADTWKQKGNECFRLREYADALRMYDKAWNALAAERRDLAVLFSNRAICAGQMQEYSATLRSAGTAMHLDPKNAKAKFWVQEAKKKLEGSSKVGSEGQREQRSKKGKGQKDKKGKGTAREPELSRVQDEWYQMPEVLSWDLPPYDEDDEGTPEEGNSAQGAAWEDLKDCAKTLFGEKRWAEADAKYVQAILAHPVSDEVAKILSNMAAAALEVQEWRKAAVHASVAYVIFALSSHVLAPKAWVRRARALEELVDTRALAALEGMAHPLGQEEAQAMRQRREMRERVQPISEQSTEAQYEERESLMRKAEEAQGPSADPARVGMLHTMYKMAPRHVKRRMEAEFGPLIARDIPPFHTDFPKQHGWPVTDPRDVAICAKILNQAYFNSTAQPWMTERAMKSEKYPVGPADLMKRFNGVAVLQWLQKHDQVRMGTVVPVKEETPAHFSYTKLNRQSFTNHPQVMQILQRGKVHVAVGFNDLGILLHCRIQGSGGPVRFVGIDFNPFCIAKSLVIVEMLRSRAVPLSHCLQAWYSAAWSTAAAGNFQEAAADVSQRSGLDPKVLSYIRHWASCPRVPLHAARHRWLKAHEKKTACAISDLKRHKDRMALCQYWLTGDVMGTPQEKAQVGSLAMWAVPEGSPPLADDESVFETFRTGLLAERPAREDIVERVCSLLTERLQRLRDWIRDSTVQIELKCATVALGEPVVQEIAALKPWGISWSNVLDYMAPSTFHRLARACSAVEDTVHVGYTMNWVAETVGTCIIDYPDPDARAHIISATHEALRVRDMLPTRDLLVNPPFDTPLNTTTYFLAMGMHKKWVEYFFRPSVAGKDINVGPTMIHPFSPLARTSTVVELSWSYDPTVSMRTVLT